MLLKILNCCKTNLLSNTNNAVAITNSNLEKISDVTSEAYFSSVKMFQKYLGTDSHCIRYSDLHEMSQKKSFRKGHPGKPYSGLWKWLLLDTKKIY